MAAEWYKEQPKNRNFLNPIGFLLKIDGFEGTDFFCQSANLPDLNMPVTEVASPFRNLPIVPGGGVTFGDLVVSFIIDEDLVNYTSITKWIRLHGRADDNSAPNGVDYRRANLHILTSSMNTNHIIEFRNIFPVALTGVNFDATVGDVEYITATVTFKFQEMFIRDESFQTL